MVTKINKTNLYLEKVTKVIETKNIIITYLQCAL